MIFVTGDIHGEIDIGKLATKSFPQQKNLTKEDYVIVCGDFGLVWDGSNTDKYWQKWLSNKNFTTLWVDGNHENFDLLKKYPIVDKFGGKVTEITPSIYHLRRGQVLNINDKKFFVMGGASSHDKKDRKEHISWWEEEFPTKKEIYDGIDALSRNNWQVDYIITHCASSSIERIIDSYFEPNRITIFFDMIQQITTFKHWYFGHYHIDKDFESKRSALYNRIIKID